jgi:hypothetical protein
MEFNYELYMNYKLKEKFLKLNLNWKNILNNIQCQQEVKNIMKIIKTK